jgi:hypothetical protein
MMNVTGNSFKPSQKQGSPPPQPFDHQKMIMESLVQLKKQQEGSY